MVLIQLICLSFLLFQIVKCDDDFSLVGNYCSHGSHVDTHNIDLVLQYLSHKASRKRFYSCNAGENSDKVYGVFNCRDDVSHQVCNDCIQDAVLSIGRACSSSAESIVWYDKCMLLYSKRSTFPLDSTTPFAWNGNVVNATNPNQIAQVLSNLTEELVFDAATSHSSIHFATSSATLDLADGLYLYALVQCRPDMTDSDCNLCLQMASTKMDECCNGSINAAVFLPSCQLRYSRSLFYNELVPPHRLKSWQIALIVMLPMVGFGLLVLFSIRSILHRRQAKRVQKGVNINEIKTVESLQSSFSAIKAAANNFSEDYELGKGGFGEVYKGKLGTGQEIAVKRLSRNSEQGILEFKNEVLLVAKLQHRNLVRLLGFCITSKEKILIYEFLQNSSLDHFLYDPSRRASLNWETRFKIITGIARGLLYLHEDSRLKIIHRDLKCSNILLDEAMNPKISDFGIAKLVDLEQTEGDTSRIVGTYGYMAPEYAMAGQFSVKSDVYSFGVIVLEIVSGQRNTFLHPQHEEGLLHRAWKLWNQGGVFELVDSLLGNEFSSEEVRIAVHIGLLCIDEDATSRPNMTSIVSALNGQSITLPLPTQPHIYTISSLDNLTTTNYYSLQVEDGIQPNGIS